MTEAYTLFSGSTGNCCYISHEGESILIDAGVSCRKICHALAALGTSLSAIRAIFITHEHTDHICGLDTISKTYRIPILCTKEVARSIAAVSKASHDMLRIIVPGDEIHLSHMTVLPSTVPHDSADNVCYRIHFDNGEEMGYATDIGHLSKGVAECLCGCRYVVIESNHDLDMLKNGEYPYYLKRRILSPRGHLSNAECASFLPILVSGGCVSIVLAHLSRENNTPTLAYDTCEKRLTEAGTLSDTVRLCVAAIDQPIKII